MSIERLLASTNRVLRAFGTDPVAEPVKRDTPCVFEFEITALGVAPEPPRTVPVEASDALHDARVEIGEVLERHGLQLVHAGYGVRPARGDEA